MTRDEAEKMYDAFLLAIARKWKLCPFGWEPCRLKDPHCNVSPGLHIAIIDGKERDVCGDCLRENGLTPLLTAR